MASDSNTGFEAEAYKLTISDVAQGKQDISQEGIFVINISVSDPKFIEKTLILKMVWIQGTIIDITENEIGEKAIALTDDTGIAHIHEFEIVPGGDHPKIAIGSYIGILGQILQVTPRVEIKAVKVMCYVEKPLLKTMWPDEVRDLKTFLLNSTGPEM